MTRDKYIHVRFFFPNQGGMILVLAKYSHRAEAKLNNSIIFRKRNKRESKLQVFFLSVCDICVPDFELLVEKQFDRI